MRLSEVVSMEIMQLNQVEPLDQRKAMTNPSHLDRDGQNLPDSPIDLIFSTPPNNAGCKFICHWRLAVAKYLDSTYCHFKYFRAAEGPLLIGVSPTITKYIS